MAKWTSLYAATSEKHDRDAFAAVPKDRQVTARGIEVGHIFYFGTKYSEPMKAVVAGPDGTERPVHMGSYGIGPSRLVAAVIEASHDDAGIVWPEAVAPFDASILNLRPGDSGCDAACENSTVLLPRKARRRSSTTAKSGPARIRDRRSDRPAMAGHRGPERLRSRTGRGEAPRDGRALLRPRRGCHTDGGRWLRRAGARRIIRRCLRGARSRE